jgi:hypothetical protein
MKLNEAFPSKYMNASDLEEGDITVTIAGAEWHEFKQQGKPTPESKPVLLLENEKPLVLNKTNFKTISDILGSDDTDDWTGQQITLTAVQVESFGEQTMAVRVKVPRAGKQAAPARAPQAQPPRPHQPRAVPPPPPSRAASPGDDDIPF